MDCDRVLNLLDAYIDGELDLLNTLEVEQHLESCADCRQKAEQLRELHAVISSSQAALTWPTPPRLRSRIRAAMPEGRHWPSPWFGQHWRLLAGAAAVMLALLVWGASLAAGWPGSATATRQLAKEVQSAHVRSLMANHLMDIPSTDQHTVKPWFDGKLDFSPPVVDLAAQGFPLVGGRLDYLDNQPAAALIYMRNKHVINLFVWPSADRPSGVTASSEAGYNLLHWNQAAMTWWAASDLNPAELHEFVDLVQASFK